MCDNITSLSISGAPESTGVTTFVQEACTSLTVLGAHHKPSYMARGQSDFQDLKEYFRRPRLISAGVVATATRTRFADFDIVPSLLFTVVFPDGITRLRGVYGARFKLVFSLQIAATPFHQGVLAMGWQYDLSTAAFDRGSVSNTITNLPHVRLDVSTDTMAVLEIPFLSTSEFAPISQDALANASYGTLSVNTILPIPSVVGLTPPTFKLYVHLEDLELIGARAAAFSAVTPQAGKSLRPVEKELDATKPSGMVAKVSETVRFIGRGIPSISSITGVASWFLDGVSGSLASFGYAKPTDLALVTRVNRLLGAFEHNADMTPSCQVLGSLATNHLATSTAFGNTDVDEMALEYVFGQFNQICVGQLQTIDAHAVPIYATSISPSHFWFRAPLGLPYGNTGAPPFSTATSNGFYPSTVFYLSQMFRYWRGGFIFRFTFAKTKHHAGRVMVSYSPSLVISDVISTTTLPVVGPEIDGSGRLQPFGYSAIFDLKDDNVFEFTVPYTAARPYCTWESNIGGLTMSVMDPLLAPSVVASAVSFMVEVRPSPGFELAVPMGGRYTPVRTTAARFQSGKMLDVIDLDSSQHTVGEKFNSVKQLIMLPNRTATAAVSPNGVSLSTFLPPWYYVGRPSETVPYPDGFAYQQAFNFGGNLSKMYVWARGGTDYNINPTGPNMFLEAGHHQCDNGKANNLLRTHVDGSASSCPRIFGNDQCPLHFRVPAYQTVARIPAAILDLNTYALKLDASRLTDLSALAGIANVAPYVTITNNGTAAGYVRISRSAADDASLCQFIGPPPLHLVQETHTALLDNDFPGTVF